MHVLEKRKEVFDAINGLTPPPKKKTRHNRKALTKTANNTLEYSPLAYEEGIRIASRESR